MANKIHCCIHPGLPQVSVQAFTIILFKPLFQFGGSKGYLLCDMWNGEVPADIFIYYFLCSGNAFNIVISKYQNRGNLGMS